MDTKITSKRTYDSSRRKEQARITQLMISEAARKLFIARGYSGATFELIALEAGVAVETVYAAYRNKRGILSRLISVSLVGDDDPTPLLQRQGPMAVMLQKDQHRQIQLFANDIAEIMVRVAPLFEVMRAAAKTEPDIADMLNKILSERVEGMKVFVNALLLNGPLQKGLTLELASETIWAITSGEVFTLLVRDRGWEVGKYKQWLTNTLTRLVIP